MGNDWVVAAFPHDAYQCRGWLFLHVHCLIAMGTPADIRRAMRDYEEAMSRLSGCHAMGGSASPTRNAPRGSVSHREAPDLGRSACRGRSVPAMRTAMPARAGANSHPRRVGDHSAIDHAALAATADCEEAGEHEFPPSPFGRVAPPVARACGTVVPGCSVNGLNLLLGKGLGDQAGLPDALHEAAAPTAVHFQDNGVIGILALSDHLDCPVRKVERVVTYRGLQAVNQPTPSGPQ